MDPSWQIHEPPQKARFVWEWPAKGIVVASYSGRLMSGDSSKGHSKRLYITADPEKVSQASMKYLDVPGS